MSKRSEATNPHLREIYKKFLVNFEDQRHATGHNLNRLFSDFLDLTVRGLHPKTLLSLGGHCKTDPANEKAYLEVIEHGKYNTKTAQYFSANLGLLMEAVYKQPYSDILGDFFSFEITNGENGQYFTPDNICKLMVEILGEGNKPGINNIQSQKKQDIYDPTAGSGRMLLKHAEIAETVKQNNFYYAQDIDKRCAQMCAINMFLNGLRGEVALGDALGDSRHLRHVWNVHKNEIFGIYTPQIETTTTYKNLKYWENESAKEAQKPQPKTTPKPKPKRNTKRQRTKKQSAEQPVFLFNIRES